MADDLSAPLHTTGRSLPCACMAIRRASRSICHLYDLVLSPTRLRSTQFSILQAIAEAGEIAHCDLARQSAASEETFSRRLASARKNGWVSVRTGERQMRLYRLTEHGRRVLEEAMPSWERAQERLRRELGHLDWQSLPAFAERLTQAALRAEKAPVRNGRPPSLPVDPAARSSQMPPFSSRASRPTGS